MTVREISLEYANLVRTDDHELKPGLQFFSSRTVNKHDVT